MEASYFTILWRFLPYINMNQPWVYMCPPDPNLPPTPYHSSRLSQYIGFECPLLCLRLGLVMFHIWSYTYFNAILKSSYPCLFPESKSLFCVCFCCVAYRVCHHCLSKFHRYSLIYCIGVFLSYLFHSV